MGVVGVCFFLFLEGNGFSGSLVVYVCIMLVRRKGLLVN